MNPWEEELRELRKKQILQKLLAMESNCSYNKFGGWKRQVGSHCKPSDEKSSKMYEWKVEKGEPDTCVRDNFLALG